MPGIEKMITVHYDGSDNLIKGIITEKKTKTYTTKPLNLDLALSSLTPFMEGKSPYSWLSKQNIPFEIEKRTGKLSIDIFSELENIVLLVRMPDEQNRLNDLIFIYLNENPSNFGVTNTANPLSTDNKSIIAFLLYNTIKTVVELQDNDRELLKSDNLRTRQIIATTESLKEELERTKDNYGLSLVKLCQDYVHNLSVKNRKQYLLSSGALEKIKKYKGDIKSLEGFIKDTITYVDNLYFGANNEIEILEWHIQFGQPTLGLTNVKGATQKEDKYARTIALLDKLEKAALNVKLKRLKLTGTNVGAACPTPISAPAISDAIYNHRANINSLVIAYPENWETIRREFRPVMNILKDN